MRRSVMSGFRSIGVLIQGEMFHCNVLNWLMLTRVQAWYLSIRSGNGSIRVYRILVHECCWGCFMGC